MARASSGIGCGDAFQEKAKREEKGEDELDERLAIVKQLKVGGFVLKIDCGGFGFCVSIWRLGPCVSPRSDGGFGSCPPGGQCPESSRAL